MQLTPFRSVWGRSPHRVFALGAHTVTWVTKPRNLHQRSADPRNPRSPAPQPMHPSTPPPLQDAITDWQTSQGTMMHLDGMAGHYTPQQVEEVKMVLRLMPVFFTTMLYW